MIDFDTLISWVIFLLIVYFLKPKKARKRSKKGYVYFILDPDTGEIKIGLSNNPKRRLKELNKADRNHNLKIIKTIYSNDMYALEKYYHNKFKAYRLPPRKYDGGTEWFSGKIKGMI